MLKRRTKVFAGLAAVAALVGGPLAVVAPADVLFVVDVAAGVDVPATTNGAFSAVGSVTNTGNVNQPADTTVTIATTGGSVTSAPGCALSGGTAVCSAPALAPGQVASYTVGVTPAAGVAAVATQVTVRAALVEANVLDPTNNTASGVTGVAYGVDGSLVNQPTEVRFGDDTLLSASITNTQAPQTVNVSIASGGVIDTRIALPAGCSVTNAGSDVSCSFALGAGETLAFDTAVAVPTSGSSITSTLTVTGANGGSSSASVVTNLFSNAQAFVPEGDFLTFQGSNQFTKFNVPVGSTQGGGTFLQLREVALNNVQCGPGTCIKQAAEAIFPSSGKYSGQDPNKPYVWEIKYNERQTCNGGGGGAGCLIDMYWIPTGETATRPMALCPTYGTTQAPRLNNIDEPCVVKVDKTQKGFATYTVAVLRDIVIPIISSTSK